MNFSGKALVVKQGRFREADAWLKLFSPSQGMFTAFAFGGLRSRKRFCGCLEPLSLALFTVSQDKGGRYQTLEEGSLLHGFPGLRSDPVRLGMAANCLRFVETLQKGPGEARDLFDLLVKTLEVLEAGEADESLPVFFRAKAAFIEGYRPQLDACAGCGRSLSDFDSPRFFVHKGRVHCPDCPDSDGAGEGPGGGMRVSQGALRALDWVRAHGPERWPELSLTPDIGRECRRLVERFVAFHLGISLENGIYTNV